MVNLRKIILNGSRDRQILCDLRFDAACEQLAIFCHGYKGYKDWGAWNEVADYFVKRKIAFLKFNFSYNGGTLDNPIDFPDLEVFGQNNYSTELNDLNLVIAYVFQEFSDQDFLKEGVHLLGHSRGGGISILGASENPNLRSLTTWAAVSDFKKRFPTGDDMDQWKNEGVRFIKNGRTKQDMPHFYQFYEDFQEHENRLTISKAAKNIRMPFLIVHGTNDEAVDYEEAEQLNNWSDQAKLESIENGNHTFGSKHPWTSSKLPNDLQKVCELTADFILS